jgi:transposase
MKGKRVKPNPEHATPEELEVAKESSPDKQQYIKLYAIQRLLEGKTNKEVAKDFSRDENTITRWVKKWNEGGIDAMRTIKPPGRPGKLSEDQLLQIKELLLTPSLAGECHWTIVKLRGYIRQQWQMELGYTTLLESVAKLGFRQVVPRTWSSKQDARKRASFLAELDALKSDPANEIWFADESGFIADPRPRRRWVLIGSRPKIDYTGMHIRLNIVGAVSPATGQFESIIVPQVDCEVFQLFLDQFAKATSDSPKNIHMVLDNASWHKAKCLNWHHITPIYLPTYSPDLNPIERLWARFKSLFFSDWTGKSFSDLWDRLLLASHFFIDNEVQVKQTCSF